MPLKLNVIIGSTRPGRAGPTIAKWVIDAATAHGAFEAELIDLADFNLPLFDEPAHPRLKQYQHEHTKKWSESVASADAYVFVSPEYDYFPPAALVNAIQFLSAEWEYKTAAVVSYGGISGGLRSSQELRQLIGNLNMMAIPQSVPLPFYAKFIDDEQTFVPTEQSAEGLKAVLNELHKWASALQPMRSK